MIDLLKQEKIALEVIKVLKSRFDNFPDDLTENRNAPFHTSFLNAFADKLQGKVISIPFFISLSSWAHGLSTTLGQNFFENVAHILCDGEKKEFNTRRNATLKISLKQRENVSVLINELSNGRRKPSLTEENSLLFGAVEVEQLFDATDFTADVFFEDESQVVCIELKTVKPNKGVFKVEKLKILEAKAALKNKFPEKTIHFYLAFPFDPLSSTPTDYDKDRFMLYAVDFRKYLKPVHKSKPFTHSNLRVFARLCKFILKTLVTSFIKASKNKAFGHSDLCTGFKYLAKDEFLLATELWDFLSGESETMETILKIINSIATVKFLEDFAFLQNRRNLKDAPDDYIKLLTRWHLRRETYLAENDAILEITIQNSKSARRVYNQSVFTDEGKYNLSRLLILQDLI